MIPLDRSASGRHFLQIPGPTNVPDRVLRAIDAPTIDHRGPEFAVLAVGDRRHEKGFQDRRGSRHLRSVGDGAWEAALVNTLSPGDRVLMAETGHFATLWKKLAERLGLVVDFLPGDWRHGADVREIEAHLAADRDRDPSRPSSTTRRRPA
jgi:alanine-glyoxylate transaminase/serine-glyoxylate transaminase/serine-pyruvate transaminase